MLLSFIFYVVRSVSYGVLGRAQLDAVPDDEEDDVPHGARRLPALAASSERPYARAPRGLSSRAVMAAHALLSRRRG